MASSTSNNAATTNGAEAPPAPAVLDINPKIHEYYDEPALRMGYSFIQGGVRHLGYWERDTWWPFPISAALRRMEDKILEGLDLFEGAAVLDAGCGDCQVALHLARQGRLQITGIDVLERHLQQARTRIAGAKLPPGAQVTARLGDYHNLDWIPDESLDGIYTIEALVHANDLARVLANFYRILKPGGRLVLLEYQWNQAPPTAQDLGASSPDAAAVVKVEEDHGVNNFLPADFAPKTLCDAGFDVDGVRQDDFSVNIRPHLRLLMVLAIVPFLILRVFGLDERFPFLQTAAVGLHFQKYWRYAAVRATKPGKLVSGQLDKKTK